MQQDLVKGVKLWTQAAELGSMSKAHFFLGKHYYEGGNLKKAKFHYKAAAMAGHDVARCNLGCIESESGNIEQAMKHWAIAASAGYHTAMVNLIVAFRRGHISRETSTQLWQLTIMCGEKRSEARDARILMFTKNNC